MRMPRQISRQGRLPSFKGSAGRTSQYVQERASRELTLTRLADPESSTCCCGHGARCTCSLKKEPYLDTVPEDISQILHNQPREPLKARGPNVNQHDSKPTIFTNGHHKPVHKFNDAHNHCGAPYRVPSRSNSHHGHGHREIAQRSSDSLPLPTTRAPPHHESPLHNVTNASQPVRQARSEHSSPLLSPTSKSGLPPFQIEIPPLNPGAYSYSPFDAQSPSIQPGQHLPENIPDNWFTTHDEAHNYGPPSVPELAFIDWSKYGFGANLDNQHGIKSIYGSLTPNMNSQIPSYAASMEHLNQLASSGFNTSSGEISEVEDLPNTPYRPTNLRTISHASNDISSNGGDDESHRLSSASSYFGTPAANMLAGNLEDLDIDKFISEQKQKQNMSQAAIHPSQAHTPDLYNAQQQPTPPQSMSTPPESIRGYSITSNPSTGAEHSFTISEAQAYAHMPGTGSEQMRKQMPTLTQNMSVFEDPMWCQPDENEVDSPFRLDDEREDEQWVR